MADEAVFDLGPKHAVFLFVSLTEAWIVDTTIVIETRRSREELVKDWDGQE